MGRDVMILMRATSITRAIGRGGPWKIETFLGPEMAISEAQKSILYSHDRSAYSAAGNMWTYMGIYQSLTDT